MSEMHSIQNLSIPNAGNSESSIGVMRQPQTEGFDFLTYLLGLQDVSVQSLLEGVDGKSEASELSDLLDQSKGELSQGNKELVDPNGILMTQIFPSSATPQTKSLSADLNSVADAVSTGKAAELAPTDAHLSALQLIEQGSTKQTSVGDLQKAGIEVLELETYENHKPNELELQGKQNMFSIQGKIETKEFHARENVVDRYQAAKSNFIKEQGNLPSVTNQETRGNVVDTDSRFRLKEDQGPELTLDSFSNRDISHQGREGVVPLVPFNSKMEVSEISDTGKAKVVATLENIGEVTGRVESLVNQGGGRIKVSLSPPELGQLEIEVVTRSGNVEVTMKASSELARGALEGRFEDLKVALNSQELNLSKIEVSVSKETSFSSTGDDYFGRETQDPRQFSPNGGGSQSESSQKDQPTNPFTQDRLPIVEDRINLASVDHFRASGAVDLRI